MGTYLEAERELRKRVAINTLAVAIIAVAGIALIVAAPSFFGPLVAAAVVSWAFMRLLNEYC